MLIPNNGMNQKSRQTDTESRPKAVVFGLFEFLLLVGLFFLLSPPIPGVNEPHYLCKARSFWNDAFCPGDLFLDSADAHYVFYYTLGWLADWFSLPVAAIIGRVICWSALAFGWQFLCRQVFEKRFWSVLAAALMVWLIRHCHFAGEWLIGGVEAKCLAYALVFVGLGFLVQNRWPLVWLLLGIASAFHVLVGGWAVIAATGVWFWNRGWKSSLVQQMTWGGIGLAIALTGLVPALSLTWGTDPQVIREANRIYTFERIAHHLLFNHIVQTTPIRLELFAGIAILWAVSCWVIWPMNASMVRLNGFVGATLGIAIFAAGLETYLLQHGREDTVAALMRYYWYRLSDVFIPLGLGCCMIMIIRRSFRLSESLGAVLVSGVVLLVASDVTLQGIQQQIRKRSQADALTLTSFGPGAEELNRKIMRDWIDVCVWIRNQTPDDARLITPKAQSTFKWYAQRSEVVSWKDVPQDATGLVAWKKRFDDVYGADTFRFGLATVDAERRLLDLGRRYQARFVVIERRHVRERKRELNWRFQYRQYLLGIPLSPPPFDKPVCLKQVYPNRLCSEEIRRESSYLVYELTIPESCRNQLKQLDEMNEWYTQLAQWYSSRQDTPRENQ